MSAQYDSDITSGLMDDGETPYVPGVNCGDCGRFVGRDGHIAIGHFEMSNEVAYVEGTCGPCLAAEAASATSDLTDRLRA